MPFPPKKSFAGLRASNILRIGRTTCNGFFRKGEGMKGAYKIIELVGSSKKSWEEAAKNAVETAGKSLRDLRVAEIEKLDMKVENNKVTAFRAKVKLSFKYVT